MGWKKAKSGGKGAVAVWYRSKPEAEVHVWKGRRGYEVNVYVPELTIRAKSKKEAEKKAREYMKRIDQLVRKRRKKRKKKK